jgi:hypothetical protein
MSKQRLLLVAAVFLAISGVSAISNAQVPTEWSPWISDEGGSAGGWASCNYVAQGINGFACRGPYCDDISVLCAPMPHATRLGQSLPPPFSEEWDGIVTFRSGWYNQDQQNYEVCNWGTPTPGVVGGVSCTGAYCDNIWLECNTPSGNPNPTFSNCAWTSSWFSEEQGAVLFGTNRFLSGIWCSGAYCDNKKFYVCKMS